MEDIKDANYMLTKRCCRVFEVKKFCEYHNLHLKSDTLLLDDFFKKFRKMYLKIY